MNNLSTTIRHNFCYYFEDFYQRVVGIASELSEEEFWHNPYPYGNSVGHLTLHVIGNLNCYIGAQLAASGYIRDREREFATTAQPAKAVVLHDLRQVIDLVVATLATQTTENWQAPYRANGVDDVYDRFGIFLRCALHFHHHIGQMNYTRDELLQRRAA